MVSFSKQNEVARSQEVSSTTVDTEVVSRHEVNNVVVDNVAEKSIGVDLVGGKQMVAENTMQEVELVATHEGLLML